MLSTVQDYSVVGPNLKSNERFIHQELFIHEISVQQLERDSSGSQLRYLLSRQDVPSPSLLSQGSST